MNQQNPDIKDRFTKPSHKNCKSRKADWKEPKNDRILQTLKSFRSRIKGMHSRGKEFQSLGVRGKILLTWISL